MSDNDFRLAGGLGIDPSPIAPNQQVMTQGIGFPLRPIDNVPDTDSPTLPDGLVAEGLFMQWMGNWRAGVFYPKGSYVRDGLFASVANKLTLDKPAPEPTGSPTFSLPDPWVGHTTQSNVSVVASGQTYTFTDNGWIKQVRVQVPDIGPNVGYRLVIIDVTDPENPVTTILDNPLEVLDDWSVVALLNQGVIAGQVFSFSLEANNSAASTDIDGGWLFQGNTQTGAPIAEAWTVDNQQTTFRINKFDLDSTDRSTELESVLPESTISVVETANIGNNATYRVASVIDQGTYMEYVVVLQSQAGAINPLSVTNIEIDVPIPLATEYDEETGVWGAGDPAWATVEGFLFFDGVNQAVDVGNAYGVDLEFEPAIVSPDWDIITG